MNKKDIALQCDRDERYLDAIRAYEEFFLESDPGRQDYLNLFALYFYTQDYVTAARMRLDKKLLSKAEKRVFELLDEAEWRFGNDTEIDFWRRYIRFRYYDKDFEDCEALAKRGDSLVPYFFLINTAYNIENMKTYLLECRSLYKRVKDGGTTYERIIRSELTEAFDKIERSVHDKQLDELGPEEFEKYPVWFFPCEDDDDLTVRPYIDQPDEELGELLVRTIFTDQLGNQYKGNIHWINTNDVGYLHPIMYFDQTGDRALGFWTGIREPDDSYFEHAKGILTKQSLPITFKSDEVAGLKSIEGVLHGIYYIGANRININSMQNETMSSLIEKDVIRCKKIPF